MPNRAVQYFKGTLVKSYFRLKLLRRARWQHPLERRRHGLSAQFISAIYQRGYVAKRRLQALRMHIRNGNGL
ncbi:MAG: hypothetical protein BCS36_12255 [Desulfovibrio sp. MES5]|nr:MAG: hypothetical protein BCS36_12255 [Desulfovibrio sp. MES5]